MQVNLLSPSDRTTQTQLMSWCVSQWQSAHSLPNKVRVDSLFSSVFLTLSYFIVSYQPSPILEALPPRVGKHLVEN